MKKQARQVIILAVFLVILGGGYLALRSYHQKQENQTLTDDRLALMQLDTEDIIRIRYNCDAQEFSFEKGEDTWYSVSDPTLSLTQYYFSTMTSYLASLRVEETIGETADLAQYGLEEPEKVIVFETEQESYTLWVGDYNSIAGGYYICFADQNEVYVIQNTFRNAFNHDLDSMVQETQEESTESESTESESTESESTESEFSD